MGYGQVADAQGRGNLPQPIPGYCARRFDVASLSARDTRTRGRVGVFVLAIAVAVGGASIVKYVWLRLRATRHRHHGSLHTTRPPSQTPEAKVPMSSPGKDSTLDIENTFFS